MHRSCSAGIFHRVPPFDASELVSLVEKHGACCCRLRDVVSQVVAERLVRRLDSGRLEGAQSSLWSWIEYERNWKRG